MKFNLFASPNEIYLSQVLSDMQEHFKELDACIFCIDDEMELSKLTVVFDEQFVSAANFNNILFWCGYYVKKHEPVKQALPLPVLAPEVFNAAPEA